MSKVSDKCYVLLRPDGDIQLMAPSIEDMNVILGEFGCDVQEMVNKGHRLFVARCYYIEEVQL